MQSKKAVIDIGTNTFHLLIAQIDNQKNIHIIYKDTIAVKLGEGGINKGFIAEAAYQRGIAALIVFRAALNQYQIKQVKTTATAAVRDASNGKDFIIEALAKADIHIEIIDGLQEATYIYRGAKAAQVLSAKTSLIMDIGGGSVEFIIGNADEIYWKKSFRLGAARLLADFYFEDPLSLATLQKIEKHFDTHLKDLADALAIYPPLELIGTAGSFDSYAEMMSIQKKQTFNLRKTKSYTFNKQEFKQLLEQIIASSHSERLAMEGLIPLRVDMILMASILTQYVLKIIQIKEVVTCAYSLKEGLLMSED